jgi:hypothetical protein
LVAAAAVAIPISLAAGPPAMAAVTIGSKFVSSSQNNLPCDAISCTAVTFDASAAIQASGGLRSPIDGVVTSWRIKSGSAGNEVTLRVLRPGVGLSFTGAGTSSTQTTTSGIAGPFATQLPIKTGDAIGVDNSSGAQIYGVNAGATLAYWSPPLSDGASSMGTSYASEAQVEANVEADVDCDGRGDETQDTNLGDGPCKSPPAQTLKAKNRQKLAKAAVRDTLDKAGTVTLRARVKLPKRSHLSRPMRVLSKVVRSKKSTTSLAAGTRTKIRPRFSRSVRKRIRAAIAAAGPRKAKVTATATDSFGNTSTARVGFKLTG